MKKLIDIEENTYVCKGCTRTRPYSDGGDTCQACDSCHDKHLRILELHGQNFCIEF